MKTVITYAPSLTALMAELKAKGRYDAETDTYNTGIKHKTAIKHNGDESLCFLVLEPTYNPTTEQMEYISPYDSLQILGTYEEVFANPELDALYKRVHPYDVEIEQIQEDGSVIMVLPNKYVGGLS